VAKKVAIFRLDGALPQSDQYVRRYKVVSKHDFIR
jgi:hypothetical protein